MSYNPFGYIIINKGETMKQNDKNRYDLIRESRRFRQATDRELDFEDFEKFCKLRRLSNKHKRLCEDNCNGTITEELYLAKISKLETTISDMVKSMSNNLFVVFQHDPRGLTVSITTQSNSRYTEFYYLIGYRW